MTHETDLEIVKRTHFGQIELNRKLTEKLNKAKQALEVYAKIEKEYLELGGLFNPELMSLADKNLSRVLSIARETLAELGE